MRILQHFLRRWWNSYTTVTQSPEPRQLGWFAPHAGEDWGLGRRGYWMHFTTTCKQLKIFKLNRKDCQLQSGLVLVWKGYLVQSVNNDTTGKDEDICNIVGPPYGLLGPGNFYWLSPCLIGSDGLPQKHSDLYCMWCHIQKSVNVHCERQVP
jgi:hypothetical protein